MISATKAGDESVILNPSKTKNKMKTLLRSLSVVLLVAVITGLPVVTQAAPSANEINSFRNFQEANDGRSNINAYLLSYIAYLSYAERVAREVTGEIYREGDRRLTDDALFVSQFKQKAEPLFWNPPPPLNIKSTGLQLSDAAKSLASSRPIIGAPANLGGVQANLNVKPDIVFFTNHTRTSIGLDPEAIAISTPKFIIICFRGTDRVLSNDDYIRGAGEWVGTDFKAPMVTPAVVSGRVHQGFWQSIDLFRSDLDRFVLNNDPNHTKHIWVTGHSLGGALAVIYADSLIESGKIPLNRVHCYTFGGPSFAGDQTFANKIEALGSKMQRFEFQMDMVTMVPPGLATAVGSKVAAILGDGCTLGCMYAKSGQRNWYQSETTFHYNYRERTLPFDIATPNTPCDHNPNWYVRSAYNQLSATEKQSVPDPAPKTQLAACNPDGSPVTISTLLAPIFWVAGNLVDNLLGKEVAEGQYKLVCYAFKNNPKKYLTWNGTVGSQLTISTSGTVFNLTHKLLPLPGGYQLWKGGANMAADVHFPNVGGKAAENTNNILMKAKDLIIGDEETWYFFKIKEDTYALYNWNTHQILDAPDNCLTSSGNCPVNEFSAKSNAPTQVWILEKQ